MQSKRHVPLIAVLLPIVIGSAWLTAFSVYLVGGVWVMLFGVWYAYAITMVVILLCLLTIWRKLD